MYYEEKLINGKLYFRNTPNGEWHKVSYEQLLSRYLEAENQRDKYYQQLIQLQEDVINTMPESMRSMLNP